MDASPLDGAAIAAAAQRIAPHVRRTPVIEIDGADLGIPGIRLVLKLEFLQHAGSFQDAWRVQQPAHARDPGRGHRRGVGRQPWCRGRLRRDEARRSRDDLRAERGVPRQDGADPRLWRAARGRRRALRRRVEGERALDRRLGCDAIHAYDQWETLQGQATVGLEYEQQAPKLDALHRRGG